MTMHDEECGLFDLVGNKRLALLQCSGTGTCVFSVYT